MSTAHRQTGRGDTGAIVSGPRAGHYETWCCSMHATPGAVTTSFRFTAPYDCRIMEANIATSSSAGGASRPTVMVTRAGNNVFSGNVTVVTADEVVVTPTSSPSLVAAQRDVAKGDVVIVAVTSVASEVVAGFVGTLTVWVRGHVVASVDND